MIDKTLHMFIHRPLKETQHVQSGSHIKTHIHTQYIVMLPLMQMMTDSKQVSFDNDAASECYFLQLHLLLQTSPPAMAPPLWVFR